MALKKVKGTLERVLDKNLQDLVRGIRNHKETEVGISEISVIIVLEMIKVRLLQKAFTTQ